MNTLDLSRHTHHVIGLMGDVHGSSGGVERALRGLAKHGVTLVLQLGDFGVWPGPRGKKFLMAVDAILEELSMEMLVTLGNHEDHARLDLLWSQPKRSDAAGNHLPLDLGTKHVKILPRPYRFQLQGVDFVSLGGAASVDFDWRTEGADWWPTEAITREQVDAAIAYGSCDVLLTHESPDVPMAVPAVAHLLQTNTIGFSQDGLTYSAASRILINEVAVWLKPKVLAHGHMHVSQDSVVNIPGGGAMGVMSLSEEYTNGCVRLMDLTELHRAEEASIDG